ncbi:MAG: hypothetical protein KJ955_08280 [Nanoarchaeota archaeon]|nr:hypothetical protein [Nanoarchaeota archaeon]
MIRELTAIVAAVGIVSCVKDVPVYSPEPEVVQELPEGETIYRQVWSNAERLELGWYQVDAAGQRIFEEKWTRLEPADSNDCLRKEVRVGVSGVDARRYQVSGKVNVSFTDSECDGLLDVCEAELVTDDGRTFDVTYDMCITLRPLFLEGDDFSQLEMLFSDMYNIDQEVELWHERKGVE